MKKRLVSISDANVLKGINDLANAVGSTMGPKGRTVIIQDDYGQVRTTKDGVSVARGLYFQDPVMHVASTMLKESAIETVNKIGDGTTTATVLAQKFINTGFDYIKTKGLNPMAVKAGMDFMVEQICKDIDSKSIKVTLNDVDILNSVATVSVNGDETLGKIISGAIRTVGPDGVITIKETQTPGVKFELNQGYSFNRGFASGAFINNQKKKNIEMNDVHIILVQESMKSLDGFFRLLGKHIDNLQKISGSANILLICDEIEQSLLDILALNKIQGKLNIAVVKSPGINLDKEDLMDDLSAVVGAMIINPIKGLTYDGATNRNTLVFGYADSVVINDKSTTLINVSDDSKKRIAGRVENLTSQLKELTDDFQKKKQKERIAMLSGGVGVVYVGSNTELETKEITDRVDDGVNAVKSVLKSGVIQGGGSLLAKVNTNLEIQARPDFRSGASIIADSLYILLYKMLENAGYKQDEIFNIWNAIKNNDSPRIGYDVKNDNFAQDMIVTGIIDSAEMLKTALRNAVSIAGLFLTTEYIIVNPNDSGLAQQSVY